MRIGLRDSVVVVGSGMRYYLKLVQVKGLVF